MLSVVVSCVGLSLVVWFSVLDVACAGAWLCFDCAARLSFAFL